MSASTCKRCGRTLCKEHAPARGRRCGPCEARFLEIIPTVQPATALVVATHGGSLISKLAAPILIWGGALTGLFGGLALLDEIGAVVGFLSGFIGSSVLFKKAHDAAFDINRLEKRAIRRSRKRFLRERQHPNKSGAKMKQSKQ